MKYAVAIVLVLLVIGGLVAIKGSQIASLMAAGEEAQAHGPPPEAVGSATIEPQVWEETIDAVGTVATGRDVAIRTEVPGVVRRIAFESGTSARPGDVLVELDASVERADLAGALAAERLARISADRTRMLVERGALAGADRDAAEADLATAVARVASLRAVIAKKTIRAPFPGQLGIREVNVGQFLDAGTTVTTIGGDARILVDFTVPQRRLSELSEGMPVRIDVGEDGESFIGTLLAIEPAVHAGTRAAGLRAVVDGGEELLRAGMFVDVHVVLAQTRSVLTVPATAVVHAAYGDSLFFLEDRTAATPGIAELPDGTPVRIARQAFVRAGEQRGDFVSILEGGEVGREVVSIGAFKLRNGSPVYVTETGAPAPELDPHPEGR